jgi:hypothetical protein
MQDHYEPDWRPDSRGWRPEGGRLAGRAPSLKSPEAGADRNTAVGDADIVFSRA